jgi:ATP-binding cassette subfamily B protein RaxB
VVLNCSFEVSPGESVAVVGPSGGGKTTLVKLMLGLPRADGRQDPRRRHRHPEARHRSIPQARRHVMQDDQLFAGSIADNISFFDPSPTSAHRALCTSRGGSRRHRGHAHGI